MLDNLRAGVSQILTNRKFLIVLFLSAIFIAVALYVYNYYISPKLDPSFVPNKEFVEKTDAPKTAEFYFFYTEWCPHSKKSKPIVDKVKTLYDDKPINGVTVKFYEVNGETEEDKMNEFEKRHNVSIDGYPTIYLVKGDQVIEYDANPTQDSLTEFLNTTL
jgi:thiol-disulfide isomerase/thioredoxin